MDYSWIIGVVFGLVGLLASPFLVSRHFPNASDQARRNLVRIYRSAACIWMIATLILYFLSVGR